MNSPLRVDFVPADKLRLPGRLGMTLAPGKKDEKWSRDLSEDLPTLRADFHTDVLVCLLEEFELEMLGIPDLLDRAREAGIEPRWFPIPDVSTPRDHEMPAFRVLVDGIIACLQSGQTVVVHCRGGLGRTGTVVASCLVRLGYSAEEAIAITRSARPGAVEVEEQEAWVADFMRGCVPGS
jgi:protein-tyrosine phosphatase